MSNRVVLGDYSGTGLATAWAAKVVADGGSVSAGRQTTVETLISGLIADGIWRKLDRLWLFAAENSQSALRCIRTNALATANGSPSFTTDRGYTGVNDSTTTYIDTGFNLSVGGNFTQNSAHLSFWSATNNASTGTGGCLGGVSIIESNIFGSYSDGNMYGRINDSPSSGSQGAPGTRQGHWLINRSGASATQLYQNGALFSSPNQSSGAPANLVLYVLATNTGGGGASRGTPNQLAMCSAGGNLSSGDAVVFYNRLRTYMTAVGVP